VSSWTSVTTKISASTAIQVALLCDTYLCEASVTLLMHHAYCTALVEIYTLSTGKQQQQQQQRDNVFLTSVPAAADTSTATATNNGSNTSRSRSRTPPPLHNNNNNSSRYFTESCDEQQQQQQAAAVENDYLVWGPLDTNDSPQQLQKQRLQAQQAQQQQQQRQGFAGSLMSTVQELVSVSIDMPSSGRSNALGAAERLEEMR
jgi:hypothetical protein